MDSLVVVINGNYLFVNKLTKVCKCLGIQWKIFPAKKK